MSTDFRALCAELLDELEYQTNWSTAESLKAKARAALADGPAVPEGKKPTRDELWELWLRLNNELPDRPAAVAEFWEHAQIDARARAALAKADEPAVPEGREPAAVTGQPSDGEVAELVETLKGIAYWRRHGKPGEPAPTSFDIRQADRLDRAAELLQRQALVPVSISERLPGPEDCDAAGRCWWWYPEVPGKTYGYWAYEDDAVPERALNEQPLHWLPAHALPLPEVNNG